MNLFDILGPVMVGPSSSHTAGAVRIGYISEKLLQDHVMKAEILLHGSFATTGIGHGTDKALIAGLLGMHPDDIRIPDSFAIAKKAGMEFTFSTVTLKDAHPNTAVLRLTGEHGRKIEVHGTVPVRRLAPLSPADTPAPWPARCSSCSPCCCPAFTHSAICSPAAYAQTSSS